MTEYPEFERLKAEARALAAADALAEPLVLTPEQQAAWDEWLATRPAAVRDLALRFPPTRRYWLDPPGQVVEMHAYAENGTMTVIVSPEWNPHVVFGRQVFGISPSDLHELAPQAPEPSDGEAS